MAAFLHPIYTCASLGLGIWGISLWERSPSMGIILLLLVLAGITYDNLVISLGRLINEGTFLESLNRLRFLFHNLFAPLLVAIACREAQSAGVGWASNPIASFGYWAIAFGLIAFGTIAEFRNLELMPAEFAGTLRYRAKNPKVPILAIATMVLVAVAGASIWLQAQWPWLFVGAILLFFGNALPSRIFGNTVSSAVEIGLILALLATELQVS